MEQLGKWLIVEEVALPQRRKTKLWRVASRRAGGCLHRSLVGEIRWYGPWRQYTFNPAPATTYSAECLEDIAGFLRRENKT